MSQAEPSPPARRVRFAWRQPFQYRLRTLLIVTALIAGMLAWWTYKARQQREAVTALRKAGAIVAYDFQDDFHGTPTGLPIWKAWMADYFGVDYVASVVTVQHPFNANDAELELLKNFTALEHLNLVGTPITDAGLMNLEDITTLQWLNLEATQITGDGLTHLKCLPTLQRLVLSNTRVTDAGLMHLRHLTGLQSLLLNNTKVTDAGLEPLKGLMALRGLNLESTKVTDAGVARLQKSLTNCNIEH